MADTKKTRSSSRSAAGRTRRTRRHIRVLVIRHGLAGDKAEYAKTGEPDSERPLTKEGRQKMQQVARGLVAVLPDVALLATSPYARATETAEIVARRYEKRGKAFDVVHLPVLAPGKSVNLLLNWLAEQNRDQTIAIVGHEPHLSQFVCWAMTGLRESFIELKKGAAVLLEFPDEVRAGHGKLLWLMQAGQLKKLAGK